MALGKDFERSRHIQGIGLLVLTAVLWSTGGFLIKWIDWNPLAIAGARSAIAAVVIRTAFWQTPLSFNSSQLIGAVSYACTVLLYVCATKLTTAANAIILQYTAPVYVALLSAWLLKEKTTRQDWLTIGAVVGGMILFFMDEMSAGGLAGNMMAMISGFTLALMAVAMRRQKEGAPYGSVFLGNLFTFVIALPFLFTSSPGTKGWIAIVLLGCFQLGLSYVFYSIAIKYVKALEASIITVIEPILNPVWVFLLLGEAPGPWALLGGGVILAALVGRYLLPVLKPISRG